MSGHERKTETLDDSEKSSPTPQNVSRIPNSKDLTLTRLRQLPASDRLWILTQAMALLCSLLVTIASGCAYYTSDFKNCDNINPYAQAFMSCIYTTLLCIISWHYAYLLRAAARDIVSLHTLSLQAKQKRRQRIPILLNAVATGQYLAALTNGLAAYRTSRVPLGVGSVCLVASVGA